jgi:hypothetical protein
MKKIIVFVFMVILLAAIAVFGWGLFCASQAFGQDIITQGKTILVDTPDQIRTSLSVGGRDFRKEPLTTAEKITILQAEEKLLDSKLAAIAADPNVEVARITDYLSKEIASRPQAIKIKTVQQEIKAEIEKSPAEYIKKRIETLTNYKVMVSAAIKKLETEK